ARIAGEDLHIALKERWQQSVVRGRPDEIIAMYQTQSLSNRSFETEIALVRQRLQVGIFVCECLDDAPAVVGRTVIDHEDLICGPRLAADVAEGLGQVFAMIEVAEDNCDGAHGPTGRRWRIPGDAGLRPACPVGTVH